MKHLIVELLLSAMHALACADSDAQSRIVTVTYVPIGMADSVTL
jgi:hypothetical protein